MVKLLDVGVGSGRSRRHIETHLQGQHIDYTGLDVSDRRLAEIHDRKAWTLIKTNVVDGLPFASGCFDVVICEQVIEHLTHPDRVMKELARVLRGGIPPCSLRCSSRALVVSFRTILRKQPGWTMESPVA